jgi:hypothetical protein
MKGLVKRSDIGHLADFPALSPPDFGHIKYGTNAAMRLRHRSLAFYASSASTSDSTSSAEMAASSWLSGT